MRYLHIRWNKRSVEHLRPNMALLRGIQAHDLILQGVNWRIIGQFCEIVDDVTITSYHSHVKVSCLSMLVSFLFQGQKSLNAKNTP